MYIYERRLSGSQDRLAEQPISLWPAQRHSLHWSGISADTSKSATTLRIGTYWANDFSKGCTREARLKFSDDLAQGFAKAMAAQGHQWAVDHDSSHASPVDWLSYPDKRGTPYDNSEAIQGVDTTDFAYLRTHGALTFVDKPADIEDLYICRAGFGLDAPSVTAEAFKVESGSPETLRCVWLNNKSKLGDKRLRWLVVDSCESLQLAGYVKSERQNLDANPAKMWRHAFHGLNMVLGFTGYSLDSWWTDDRGWDFGRRAGAGDKLAGAWMDEAYSHWAGDTPVALACGRNEADAANRLRYDRVSVPFAKIPPNQIGGFAWLWRS